MHPSIKYNMVKETAPLFSKDLTNKDKFGIGYTLLNFIDAFYKYRCLVDSNDRGLTI